MVVISQDERSRFATLTAADLVVSGLVRRINPSSVLVVGDSSTAALVSDDAGAAPLCVTWPSDVSPMAESSSGSATTLDDLLSPDHAFALAVVDLRGARHADEAARFLVDQSRHPPRVLVLLRERSSGDESARADLALGANVIVWIRGLVDGGACVVDLALLNGEGGGPGSAVVVDHLVVSGLTERVLELERLLRAESAPEVVHQTLACVDDASGDQSPRPGDAGGPRWQSHLLARLRGKA